MTVPIPSVGTVRSIAVDALMLCTKEAEGRWDLPARLFVATAVDLGPAEHQDEPEIGEKRLATVSMTELTSNGMTFGEVGSGELGNDLQEMAKEVLRHAVLADPEEEEEEIRTDVVGYLMLFEAWAAQYEEDWSDIHIAPHEHERRYELRASVFVNMDKQWAVAVYENPNSQYHSKEYISAEEPYVFDSETNLGLSKEDEELKAPPGTASSVIEGLTILCGSMRMAQVVSIIKREAKE